MKLTPKPVLSSLVGLCDRFVEKSCFSFSNNHVKTLWPSPDAADNRNHLPILSLKILVMALPVYPS